MHNLLTPILLTELNGQAMMSLTCCYRWTNFGHRMLPKVTEMQSTARALFRTPKIIKIVRETTKLEHLEIPDCFRKNFFSGNFDIFSENLE